MARIFKQAIIIQETIQEPIIDLSAPAPDEEIAEKITNLTALLQSIPSAINEHRQQLSAEIADIILVIVSKLFIKQEHNKETIIQQIKQIIEHLEDKQTVEVFLHPQDIALIQATELQKLRIVADTNLHLGGCIVKSNHGVFDSSIERQIDNLKQVLLKIRGQYA